MLGGYNRHFSNHNRIETIHVHDTKYSNMHFIIHNPFHKHCLYFECKYFSSKKYNSISDKRKVLLNPTGEITQKNFSIEMSPKTKTIKMGQNGQFVLTLQFFAISTSTCKITAPTSSQLTVRLVLWGWWVTGGLGGKFGRNYKAKFSFTGAVSWTECG